MLIDVHAHLDDVSFSSDLELVLNHAKNEGVHCIITNGTTKEGNMRVLELAKKYSIIKAALGLHPEESHHITDEQVEETLTHIENHKESLLAIGEVGLDKHWYPTDIERQKIILKKIILLAKKINKPLIVHTRDAEEESLALLEEEHAKRVILHAFGGNKKLVRKAISLGFFLSIPPNVVRTDHFQMVIKESPITQLLTETDCPYLGPLKEGRNEPKFIRLTIQKIAEIKKMKEDEVEKTLEENYKQFFKIS